MVKNYLVIFLITGLSIFILDVKSYAADNMALMQCLMQKDKKQIMECLKKNFPSFSRGYDGNSLCGTDNLPKEMRESCERAEIQWFDKLLGIWQVLYSQCSSAMTIPECIASIDLRPCEEVGIEKDDGMIGGFGKGTCYALAAFVKKSASICQNQFYLGTKSNCNVWLEMLSSDCADCKENTSSTENQKRYFNWVYDDGTVGMEDTSYCEGMSDLQKRDDCFLKAAYVLVDPSLCERISTTERSDDCYLSCANTTEQRQRDFCDRISDPQRRTLCRQVAN